MKLEYSTSARRDSLIYLALLFGFAFLWVALADPANNCGASGRECAPWATTAFLCMGLILTATAVACLIANPKRGSRLNLARRRLFWWETDISKKQSISLDDLARIKVRLWSDSSDQIFFYGRDGGLLPVPNEGIFPCEPLEWAQGLANLFPHVEVEVEGETSIEGLHRPRN